MSTLSPLRGTVITVTGPLEPEALGFTLPHEHIMSTFGAELARYPDYDRPRLLETVLPYLEKVKDLGCQTVLDCTAAYFGRHPELLRYIAQVSGMQIITNTGYYAAASDRYVPEHALSESAEQIASRWVHEFRDSIDESGIYPGFIKTAVDDGEFSELDRKLVRAAILTHRQTGLTIQTHTGNNLLAVQAILAMLAQEGVHPSAWVWVHAHALPDTAPLIAAAQLGAWISLDGVNADNAGHVLVMLRALKLQGLLGQALLSHDGDSYCLGSFRPYHYIMTDFLPSLAQAGFNPEEIRRLTVENPARAFTITCREL